MKNLFKITLLSAITFVSLQSCSDDDQDKVPELNLQPAVVQNYAKMVHQNYKDSYDGAVAMQEKIKAFTDAPSETTLQAAKDAWIAVRESYGQSEVYRGANGPIDTEGYLNTEGQINAWPLNEAYIDYVANKDSNTGTYANSIIGDASVAINDITAEFLAGKNEADGDEKAVATGWHAIEFLLWGQDNTAPADKISGQRPYDDYFIYDNSDNNNVKTEKNKRIKYLTVVTQLLVDDLKALVDTWAEGGSYYKEFVALDTKIALNNMLNGAYFLAFNEASEERMLAPANSTDGIAGGEGQEDEHSCFSDNTHRDIYQNAQGIFNVLQGKYGNISGTSFLDLVKLADQQQATKLETAIADAKAAIDAINEKATTGNTPFDLIIMEENVDNPGIVIAGSNALVALGEVIKESAAKLGITTVLPE